MIRYGDITGFDDAEVIEGSNYEDDRQDVRCIKMDSTDISSSSGNTVFRNSIDMGASIQRADSRHDNGD